jgi:TRAP-type C4-dicarboxylate transport system permease small subunit
MMKSISDLLSVLNQALARFLKGFVILVFLVLVVDVLWGVGTRYLLSSQAAWSEELARLLMVWLALLGAALVTREEKHLGLDIVVRSWPNEVQRMARILASSLIILFAAIVMLKGGIDLVSKRYASGQTMPGLGILKAWFYLPLPGSGLLILLFSVELILQDLLDTRPKEEGGPS